MECRDFEKNAAAISHGELSRDEAEHLEAHLAGCPKCRNLTAALAEIALEARELESAELSPQFWPRLEERLEEVDRHRADRWIRWTQVARFRLRPVAAAACLTLGVWAGYQLGDAYVASSPEATSREEARELLPYLSVLDDVPHGSFAEMFVGASAGGELKP